MGSFRIKAGFILLTLLSSTHGECMQSRSTEQVSSDVTFDQFAYEPLNLDVVAEKIHILEEQLSSADSFAISEDVFKRFQSLRSQVESMMRLAKIRHTLDTQDPFYKGENARLDELSPLYENEVNRFHALLVKSPYREQFERKHGKQLFALIEQNLAIFNETIIPDLQKENALCSKFYQLISSAQISFRGGTYNLFGMKPFETDPDRETRKEAVNAKLAFFEANSAELDTIYDDLVKVRQAMAVKLGFKNFIPIGYARMHRIGYGEKELAAFRANIKQIIKPLYESLAERKRARLGVDILRYYDGLEFKNGEAKPIGTTSEILQKASVMYNELSPATGSFFDMMMKRNLLEVENKPRKSPQGYCDYMSYFESPFIFSNFNGTSGDIDVLTHEAGHAFQAFQSRHLKVEEYYFPTTETAEIYSMSMELFTRPWMESFFGPDTLKFKFAQISQALKVIGSCAVGDAFQHEVYAHPEWTPAQRHECWKRVEAEYLVIPDRTGAPFLEKGGGWQFVHHFFAIPFYYIDYALAQVCAFEFWVRSNSDFKAAIKDYFKMCQVGGSMNFAEVLKYGNLDSPFEKATIQKITDEAALFLKGIDDSSF